MHGACPRSGAAATTRALYAAQPVAHLQPHRADLPLPMDRLHCLLIRDEHAGAGDEVHEGQDDSLLGGRSLLTAFFSAGQKAREINKARGGGLPLERAILGSPQPIDRDVQHVRIAGEDSKVALRVEHRLGRLASRTG